jgi:hypothetical protein
LARRFVLPFVALLLLAATAEPQPAPAPSAAAVPAPPPAAEQTLEQFLGQRGWAAVQLQENAFSQLEADVVLNGTHRLRVQISTSFSKSLFDEKVVKELGLAVEPTHIELTGAQKQRLGSLQVQSLSFGETSVGAATLFTADLPALLGTPDGQKPVQGVIGSDLLAKYQAVLEIPTSKLYLRVH